MIGNRHLLKRPRWQGSLGKMDDSAKIRLVSPCPVLAEMLDDEAQLAQRALGVMAERLRSLVGTQRRLLLELLPLCLVTAIQLQPIHAQHQQTQQPDQHNPRPQGQPAQCGHHFRPHSIMPNGSKDTQTQQHMPCFPYLHFNDG